MVGAPALHICEARELAAELSVFSIISGSVSVFPKRQSLQSIILPLCDSKLIYFTPHQRLPRPPEPKASSQPQPPIKEGPSCVSAPANIPPSLPGTHLEARIVGLSLKLLLLRVRKSIRDTISGTMSE